MRILLLLLCILVNIVIAVCFKMFFRKGVNSIVAIVFNYVVCAVLGSVVLGHIPLLTHNLNTAWVPYGLALGVCFILGFNIGAFSVKHTGITVTSVMMRMSLVLSAAYAIIYFGESAAALKIVGIAVAVFAVVLINAGHRDMRRSFALDPNLLYPFLAMLLAGLIESILFHVHARHLSIDHDADLTTYAFTISALLGIVVVSVLYATGRIRFQPKDYYWGLILGVPNFFTIYLILVLLKTGFDGSALFPILNISVLSLSALVGLVIFREQLNRLNFVGIAAALVTILLISMA